MKTNERVTPEPTICQHCRQPIRWRWNSEYSSLGEWVTDTSHGARVAPGCCSEGGRPFAPHKPEVNR